MTQTNIIQAVETAYILANNSTKQLAKLKGTKLKLSTFNIIFDRILERLLRR